MKLCSIKFCLLLVGIVISDLGCAPHEIVAATNVASVLAPKLSKAKANIDLQPAIDASIKAARSQIPVDIPNMLRGGDYVGADQKLRTLQAHYEADKLAEADLIAALRVITDTPDEDLEPLYAEWVRRAPESFSSYLAAGVYRNSRAFKARGSALADKTSTGQFRAMQAEFSTATRYLERSRQLNPKLVASYAYSMDAAMAVCNRAELDRLKSVAFKIDPYNWLVRDAYFAAMTPRWCGSIDAMRKFLDETLPYIAINPNLRPLKGRIAFEQGEELTIMADVPKYEEALPYYTEALAYGDYYIYRQGRAITLIQLGRYDEAIVDLEAAIRERPSARHLHWLLVFARSKQTK